MLKVLKLSVYFREPLVYMIAFGNLRQIRNFMKQVGVEVSKSFCKSDQPYFCGGGASDASEVFL